MLDRRTPPNFSTEFQFNLPSPEIIALKDNLSLVWLKEIQQDIVKVDFVFEAGKWHEPKKGVSYFTGHMLEKGTSNFTSEKIASVLDQQGAQLEISSGADFASVSLYSLTKNFEAVLPLVIEILTEPTFPEQELDLLSNIFLDTLKVNNEKNSFVAAKVFNRNVFGANHPYGRSADEGDINAISTSDLKSFFLNAFSPIEIYVTGNLNNHQFSLLTKQISNLQTQSKRTPHTTDCESGPVTEKIIKDKSLQSAIKIGKKTINRNHSDYPGLLLANHILGGYFGSRLMKNIREEKGLTYGIHSSVTSYLNSGVFSISTETNKNKADQTISEIEKEIEKLLSVPVDKTELGTAKNHFLGNLQLEVSNPFAITEKLKNIRLNKLPVRYYQDLYRAINATTDRELLRITNGHLSPAGFHLVSVG
ncbi:MAG: M16 family metallopeptidase [Cyclobacteriaceae bacterium]